MLNLIKKGYKIRTGGFPRRRALPGEEAGKQNVSFCPRNPKGHLFGRGLGGETNAVAS